MTYLAAIFMKDETEEILKFEKVGYLKSSVHLMHGTLYLTPRRLVLTAQKTGLGLTGFLNLLMDKKKKPDSIFDLEYKSILRITQGKHGLQKNVLEITDHQNNTYRILVKNYQEWRDELNETR